MIYTHLKKFDWLLLAPVILLILFGLASLYSGTLNVENPDLTLFNKQLTFFIVGLILLFLISLFDHRFLRSYSVILYIFSCLTMLAVLFWGATIRGTTGWFVFGGFGLQPVELAKLTLIIILSHLYSSRASKQNWLNLFLVSGLLTLVPVIFAILQPDFGSAFILICIWLGFFALIKLKKQHLLFLIPAIIIISILVWNFILVDYQRDRISTFLDPNQDPLGQGYNVRQSMIAVGSGHLFGRGLGLGTQSQLRFLPEVETDFIFANIAETLGFLGTSLVVIFFCFFFLRILYIIRDIQDNFGSYLVYGFGLVFFIQATINIGMNIGLLPVTGLPLPFVSYGGSFLITSLIAIGLIESIGIRRKIG